MFLFEVFFLVNLFILISFFGIIKYHKNLLTILFLLEIVLININVLLLLFSLNLFDINGLLLFLIVLVVAGIESAIGLTFFILKNRFKSVNAVIASFLLYADASVNWQINFQEPASSIMEGIINLHHDILFLLIIICISVIWVLLRIVFFNNSKIKSFSIKDRPITHNSGLEFIWTLVPTIVLISIAVPSMTLIYSIDDISTPQVTVKIIGNQWYWTYEFHVANIDNYDLVLPKNLENVRLVDTIFESRMLLEEDLQNLETFTKQEFNESLVSFNEIIKNTISNEIDVSNINVDSLYFNKPYRVLEVDNFLVLPIITDIRLLVTSTDVIHSFAVPSLGIKMDAIPGRLNQVYLNIAREGLYYGQCSEICGIDHAFMPIVIQGEFDPDYHVVKSNTIF